MFELINKNSMLISNKLFNKCSCDNKFAPSDYEMYLKRKPINKYQLIHLFVSQSIAFSVDENVTDVLKRIKQLSQLRKLSPHDVQLIRSINNDLEQQNRPKEEQHDSDSIIGSSEK